MVITQTKSNIVQYNEYYAYQSLANTSWTRENTTGNNFLGNGGTEVNSTTALYDLDFRNYDPLLARMHQVDPMAGKYSSLTPYNFAFNDPVYYNDPSGADPYFASELDFLNRVMAWGGSIGRWQQIMDIGTYGGGPNWNAGSSYSDWSPNGGSQMYRNAMAAGGTDLGGRVYNVNNDGWMEPLVEFGGQLGTWNLETFYAGNPRDPDNPHEYHGFVFNAVDQQTQGRPGPIDIFGSNQSVLNGLSEHFLYQGQNGGDVHLRDIVKTFNNPNEKTGFGEWLWGLFTDSYSANLSRTGSGKLLGQDVSFMIQAVQGSADTKSDGWKNLPGNMYLGFENRDSPWSIILTNGTDDIIALRFNSMGAYEAVVDNYFFKKPK